MARLPKRGLEDGQEWATDKALRDNMDIRGRINWEARLLGHALERGDKLAVEDCSYQLHKLADLAVAIARAKEKDRAYWHEVNQLCIEA